MQNLLFGRAGKSSGSIRRPCDRAATGVVMTAAVLLGILCLPRAMAQELYAYPQKGQSADQQGRDRYECHTWAVQQSRFDPTQQQAAAVAPAYPPPPQPEAPQGGLLRGAGRGAAVGAVGGAIAGDAGKGAAIGAGTGALIGGMRRRDQLAREQQAQQNYERQTASARSAQTAENANRQRDYNRALSACLQARGYSVN